jgi:hypothetical protein
MHTAEPFMSESSASVVRVAAGKLKKHKSPGVDQIPAELLKRGGKVLRSEIHKLMKLIWKKKNCFTNGKDQLLYLFTNG